MASDGRDIGNLVDISSGTRIAGDRNDSIPRGLWNTPYGGSPTEASRRGRRQPRPGTPGLLMSGLSDRGLFYHETIARPVRMVPHCFFHAATPRYTLVDTATS